MIYATPYTIYITCYISCDIPYYDMSHVTRRLLYIMCDKLCVDIVYVVCYMLYDVCDM